ncbi:MAG TPA: hypothetical protein VK138_16590 [Acidiferrobacterales bacterium]|nr:hypothetical protein [Acidiferrobacterales bacterium]
MLKKTALILSLVLLLGAFASQVYAAGPSDPRAVMSWKSSTAANEMLELYKFPADRTPFATASADGFSQLPYSGGAEEEFTREYLVWGKEDLQKQTWLQIRDRNAGLAWIKRPNGVEISDIKDRLAQSDHMLLDKTVWDAKIFASPGSQNFKLFDDSPPDLQLDSYVLIPPPPCKSEGTVKDRAGNEWTKKSCEPGFKFPVYESPAGRQIRFPDRTGQDSGFTTVTSNVLHVFLSMRIFDETKDGYWTRLFVFDRKNNWIKVRMREFPPYNFRWAWIARSPRIGEVKPFLSPSEKTAAIENSPELRKFKEAQDSKKEVHVKVRELQVANGRTWVLIDAYKENLCEGGDQSDSITPAMTGWVPLMKDEANIQFADDTCD